jgi:hypothetical protein
LGNAINPGMRLKFDRPSAQKMVGLDGVYTERSTKRKLPLSIHTSTTSVKKSSSLRPLERAQRLIIEVRCKFSGRRRSRQTLVLWPVKGKVAGRQHPRQRPLGTSRLLATAQPNVVNALECSRSIPDSQPYTPTASAIGNVEVHVVRRIRVFDSIAGGLSVKAHCGAGMLPSTLRVSFRR